MLDAHEKSILYLYLAHCNGLSGQVGEVVTSGWFIVDVRIMWGLPQGGVLSPLLWNIIFRSYNIIFSFLERLIV